MILDITGIDIGALVAGIGGLLKSLHSDRTAASAKKGLEERCSVLERRIDEGERRFSTNEGKIDKLMDKVGDIDKNVATILGYMKGKAER